MRSDPFENYANFTNCLTSGLKNGTGVCEIISSSGDFFIDVLKSSSSDDSINGGISLLEVSLWVEVLD